MKTTRPLTPGEWLLELIFPPRCLLCGRVVPAGGLFCGRCVGDLPEEPMIRQLALPGGRLLTAASPMVYSGGFRDTLQGFKFQGQRALARPIAQLMAEAARACYGQCAGFDGVAYSPMYPADRQRRGYDQSALLARQLARALSLPVVEALEKSRQTEAQHGLGREARKENPRGAYRARYSLAGKSLLLVDDIVTTGSTLRECALALYGAGAGEVRALCAADTPEPSGGPSSGKESDCNGHG